MKVVEQFASARALRERLVGLVPTMGYLHEGHLSLISSAAAECDTVIVSLFVNPLQFGESRDLGSYPRDRERDAELARAAGADVLFAPSQSEMYPGEQLTTVSVARVTEEMEGRFRPGHFDGVTTVVAKLFAGLGPDRAYFGRKDAQQLAVVRRMTADLSMPVAVIPGSTVREGDGLALSSRNTRLSAEERSAAGSLSTGLMAAADAARAGERDGRALADLARAPIEAHPAVVLQYAALASQEDATLLSSLDRPAFLAVAAVVGSTRLIDNVHLDVGGDRFIADRGIRLDVPSILYEEV